MLEEKLTIGEMSEYCDVPADTLRYYDKIELFRPLYTDPDNGYRYYSILQSEVLGTIVELRRVGFSIEEIRAFMQNRHLDQSIGLLKQAVQRIDRQAADLKRISRTLKSRIQHIQSFQTDYAESDFIVRKLPKRKFWVLPDQVDMQNKEAVSYGFLELEKRLHDTLPFLAGNQFGFFVEPSALAFPLSPSEIASASAIFTFVQSRRSAGAQEAPAGDYVCTRYTGHDFEDYVDGLEKLLRYLHAEGLEAKSGAWSIIQVDISLTEHSEEAVYEVQIRV
ncbi:helix-turn-helix domain-containing protein [Saccharibacillus sacchari]|uniref:Helix-turn-helix domain-containing protein n=1 Tax=Saccharibacillus sacchari TaxID=456493 RepID=A0ACC6PG80_9BACL